MLELTIRCNPILRQNPIMSYQSRPIKRAPLNRPTPLISDARTNYRVTHMIRRTSSTPSSSNPIRPSPLPSPIFSSRSKLPEDIPAAAWSEKEKVESGV